MTTPLLIEGGVYQPDGAAIVRVGQTAVLDLQLAAPDAEAGPFEPVDLDGRFFVQRLIARDGSVVTEIEPTRPDATTVRFSLLVTADMVEPARAADLTHKIVELLGDDAEDEVLARRFSIRALPAGAPSALMAVGEAERLVVRYVGERGASAAHQLHDAGLIPNPTGDALGDYLVEAAGAAATIAVEEESTGALARIALRETQAVGAVDTREDAAITAVAARETQGVDALAAASTDEQNAIQTAGDEQAARVVAEGDDQVERVTAQGIASAQDLAGVTRGFFPEDEEAGLLAVAEGETFTLINDDGDFALYRKIAGEAYPVATGPSRASVQPMFVKDGGLYWRDENSVDHALSMEKPRTRYFPALGESTTRGAGNNLGDATPTTVEAYEMEANGSLTYPLAEPVGGAVGGSMYPAFANEIRAQLHERVVIDNMAIGSTTLLAAAGTLANSWQVGGGLLAPAIARINANLAALIANPDINTTGLVVDLIWGGNPNDSVMINGTTVTGALYQAALTAVFNALKAGITVAPLRSINVIQGGDDNDGAPVGPPHINEKYRQIRAATEAAVAAEPIARIASRIARSFAYDAKRYMYDQVHWNRTGCNLLGKVCAREIAKAVPTVPYGALTPLAVTLYEDTNTATANTAAASHTPQPGCKAMLVMAGAMANTVATGTTFSGATFAGGAMALMNEEISQVAAAGTSSAARAAAWLLNNADGFPTTPQNIVVNTAGVRNNITIAVIEYGEVVVQEAGWAFKSNAAVTEIERKAYSALDCSASVLALSVATSASVLTHTMTGVTKADEGGQTDGTNSSQAVIATGVVPMNVETLIKAQFSAAVRCAVLYAVLVRRPEDGELDL